MRALKSQNSSPLEIMLTLTAQKREIFGRKNKNLRRKGFLPAILYGRARNNLPVKLDLKEFKRVYDEAGENALVTLKIKGDQETLVLIYEVARDPLSGEVIHADLYQPLLTEKVETDIPLVFEGQAQAVEKLKGILVKNMSELTVRALPFELPREIKVNLKLLETFEDQIRVRDLSVAAGVEVLREPDEIVVSVSRPEEEIEEEPKEELVEPEVVGRKEKEEELTTQEKKPEKKA